MADSCPGNANCAVKIMRWLGIHHCHGGQKSLGLKTQVGVAAIFTREPFIFQSTFSHHSSEVGKQNRKGM